MVLPIQVSLNASARSRRNRRRRIGPSRHRRFRRRGLDHAQNPPGSEGQPRLGEARRGLRPRRRLDPIRTLAAQVPDPRRSDGSTDPQEHRGVPRGASRARLKPARSPAHRIRVRASRHRDTGQLDRARTRDHRLPQQPRTPTVPRQQDRRQGRRRRHRENPQRIARTRHTARAWKPLPLEPDPPPAHLG